MAEAAFSEDGKYYSSISQDGRLRIWDTETNVLKQEYTPDLHLSSPPSCLQWISVAQSGAPPQKQGKRKSISSDETQCIALGTTSGKILIYSVAQAKIETVLTNQSSSSNITALDWHRKYGLYSCDKNNIVYEWDLNASSFRYKYNVNLDSKNSLGFSVSAIKIIPHKQKTSAKYLVIASYQAKVWQLSDGTATVIKNLGHNAAPTAILTLATLNDVCWLIEGSQNERLLSFWDVTITDDSIPLTNGDEATPHKRQRRKSNSKVVTATASYNFVLEDAPRMVNVELREEDGATKLSLAAATRSGVVHYYGHMLNGSSTKPLKPSVTIQVTTPDAHPLPLQCCSIPPQGGLVLGYTDGPVMTFERVTPDLKSKTQIIIRGDVKEPKKSKQKNEINKVKTDTAKNSVTYVEPMGGVVRKRPTPGVSVEVPMEARLANLALDVKARSKSAVNQNMTKLLIQGLHSKDKGIISTVLQMDDSAVAWRTVGSLPADYVPLLLEQLAEAASSKTAQCASVCTWLSAVLRCHSALLLATSSSATADHLAQLLAIFTHRRSHLCQLLNLKGRLELTVAQRNSDPKDHEQEPVIEYNDSSEEEEIEMDAQSDSGASWDNDKFNSDGESEGKESDSDGD